MIDWFNIKYRLGTKSNEFELWIMAHDEEEAKRLCITQAGFRHGRRNKVYIVGDYEPDPRHDAMILKNMLRRRRYG